MAFSFYSGNSANFTLCPEFDFVKLVFTYLAGGTMQKARRIIIVLEFA